MSLAGEPEHHLPSQLEDALGDWTELRVPPLNNNNNNNVNSSTLHTAPPTSGELEKLFFATLTQALPRHFGTVSRLHAERRAGRTRITNAHVLVRGCPPGTSYTGLFGTCSASGGYRGGPIVRALDEMVPFLKRPAVSQLKKARDFLAESVAVRRAELRPLSRSYLTHVHMVRVMEGTVDYLGRLLRWLSQPDVPAWEPATTSSAAQDTMDYTALTRH